MAREGSQKLKVLHIAKMLHEETDDAHGLTMPQIIERLAEKGIMAERKSVYDDIAQLRAFGLDIVTRHGGATTEYAMAARDFEFPELLLLVDAVESSRFLTTRKSAVLVDRIKTLTSRHLAEQLSRQVHVEGRIKMQNESIYYNVDAIQEAILGKRKISFKYFEYGLDKERVLRREGGRYSETPVCLVYSSEYYYLIAYNDAHSDFVRYRVDRMLDIAVLDEKATRNKDIANFDVGEFGLRSFGMFDGEKVSVDLVVDKGVVGAVIDRFGKDVLIARIDGQSARVHVIVLVSKMFFGWLAQFGTAVRIERPPSLAQEYREYLEGIVEAYKGL